MLRIILVGGTLINVARFVGLFAKTTHANATRLKGVSFSLSLSMDSSYAMAKICRVISFGALRASPIAGF